MQTRWLDTLAVLAMASNLSGSGEASASPLPPANDNIARASARPSPRDAPHRGRPRR